MLFQDCTRIRLHRLRRPEYWATASWIFLQPRPSGPRPANGAVLQSRDVPSIQAVVDSSQDALVQITVMMKKVNVLLDTMNSTGARRASC